MEFESAFLLKKKKKISPILIVVRSVCFDKNRFCIPSIAISTHMMIVEISNDI